MVDELTDLYKEFSRLDDHLVSIMDRWCEKNGITKDVIDFHMQRLPEEPI